VTNESPTPTLVQADAIGLAVLAVELIPVFHWLVPDDGFRLVEGMIAYGILAAGALYMWHKNEMAGKISAPNAWAAIIGASLLLGALSFGVDMILGSFQNPGLSPIEAGTKVGSPFGFMLTVLLCPGLTMVAVAGLVRSFLPRTGTVTD
jgi:hypothetical protein